MRMLCLARIHAETCRDVGFLRYWKLSNLPLFLLGLPMIAILTASAAWAWTNVSSPPVGETVKPLQNAVDEQIPSYGRRSLLARIALPQAVLAALAVTNYHVQVILRLSSGYPVWYWWLALSMLRTDRAVISRCIVQAMVMYAMIQGCLFAGFLPPA